MNAAAVFQREVVHQVMAQRSRRVAHPLRVRVANASAAGCAWIQGRPPPAPRPGARFPLRRASGGRCNDHAVRPCRCRSSARWLTMASLTSVSRPVRAAAGSVTDGTVEVRGRDSSRAGIGRNSGRRAGHCAAPSDSRCGPAMIRQPNLLLHDFAGMQLAAGKPHGRQKVPSGNCGRPFAPTRLRRCNSRPCRNRARVLCS